MSLLQLRHLRSPTTSIASFSATAPVTTWRSAETTPTDRGTNTRRRRVSRFSTSASAQSSTDVKAPSGPGSCLRVAAKVGSAASVSRTRSVSIQVGCALATVTPRCATSSRSASPNRSSPALAAQ